MEQSLPCCTRVSVQQALNPSELGVQHGSMLGVEQSSPGSKHACRQQRAGRRGSDELGVPAAS